MSSEIEKYEKLIVESKLFSIDKDSEFTLYKREALKMVEYLYSYLMALNRAKFEPYGLEITEVANRCIHSFDAGKGAFIHYFNASWKQEYGHITGRQIINDSFGGLKLTDSSERKVKKLYKYLISRGTDLSLIDTNCKELVSMGFSSDDIDEVLSLINSKAISNYQVFDGDEIDIFDHIIGEKDLTINDTLDNNELVLILQKCFKNLQDRQKPVLRQLLTIKICKALDDYNSLRTLEFIDVDILNAYIQTGYLPSAKEIANNFGMLEASISRSYKTFINNVKKEL